MEQRVGMTTQCPDNIGIPCDALEWRGHSDYWIMYSDGVYHNDEWRELKVDLDSLREGQTVGCMVSREGELHAAAHYQKSRTCRGIPFMHVTRLIDYHNT